MRSGNKVGRLEVEDSMKFFGEMNALMNKIQQWHVKSGIKDEQTMMVHGGAE